MNSISKQDMWNAGLYDEKHSFVSNYGGDLVSLLAPKAVEKILDLGCGTGDLANKLSASNCEVLGMDNSPNMIATAKKKYPHLNFLVGDATNLPYTEEFDAVFSNATLHWVKPPEQALASIYTSLKQGGRFVAEFGGKGNVQKISEAVLSEIAACGLTFDWDKYPWYFPSIAEYTTKMEQIGFRCIYAQHFDRPTPFIGENGLYNWLEMFGGAFFAGMAESTKNKIIKSVEAKLRADLYVDGTWIADYKRIRVIGMKE
ncbi:trans-aconitate 2-methyltransferase [Niallia sp. MER 6]|uniref:class I SAM-dependent methyltransferase n=1 Tax=Niallia sp. MER 6 TaxID=2939567 RepID=UPI002040AB3F|nr:class I SAM-dependent methyltransferase [Niallia sp. MER 6]MCM3033946.1 class I SAM-dependent methyltransferase [Niallia sp. MER 6]